MMHQDHKHSCFMGQTAPEGRSAFLTGAGIPRHWEIPDGKRPGRNIRPDFLFAPVVSPAITIYLYCLLEIFPYIVYNVSCKIVRVTAPAVFSQEVS